MSAETPPPTGAGSGTSRLREYGPAAAAVVVAGIAVTALLLVSVNEVGASLHIAIDQGLTGATGHLKPVLALLGIEAVLALGAWLISGRREPHAALALLAITAPLEVYRTPILSANVSLFRISVLIAVVVVLRGAARRSLPDLLRDPVVWAYAGLLVTMAFSLLVFSDNRDLGFKVMSQVGVGLVVIIVAAALIRQIADPLLVVGLLLSGTALPIAAACWQAVTFVNSSDPALPGLSELASLPGLANSREALSFVGNTVRLKAAFADPNHFGAYAALMAGPCLGVLVHGFRRRMTPTVIAAAALAVALSAMVLASGSRSALLALGICVIGVIGISGVPILRALSVRGRVILGVGAVVLVGVVTAAALPSLKDRLNPSSSENTVSDKVHKQTLTVAWDDFVGDPAFGLGIADFGPQLGEETNTSGAHSTYLTVAAELGAVGLLFLLLAIGATGRLLVIGVRSRAGPLGDLSVGLACGYAGFLVAMTLYDLGWDDFHWVYVGLVVGLLAALHPVSVPDLIRRVGARRSAEAR